MAFQTHNNQDLRRWMHRAAAVSAAWSIALLSACGGGGGGGDAGAGPSPEMPHTIPLGVSLQGLAASAAPALGASSSEAQRAAADVAIPGLKKISEASVGGTTYQYVFSIDLAPRTRPLAAATLELMSAGEGTSIVDGVAHFDAAPAGGSATSTDTIVLRHDRSKPFDAASLRWAVTPYFASTRPLVALSAPTATLKSEVELADGRLVADATDPLRVTDPTGTSATVGRIFLLDGMLRRVVAVRPGANGSATLLTRELPFTDAFKDLAMTATVSPFAATDGSAAAPQQAAGRVRALQGREGATAVQPQLFRMVKALQTLKCLVPTGGIETADGESVLKLEIKDCSTADLGAALGKPWPNLGTISGTVTYTAKVEHVVDTLRRDDYQTSSVEFEADVTLGISASGQALIPSWEGDRSDACRESASGTSTVCNVNLLQPFSEVIPIVVGGVKTNIGIDIGAAIDFQFEGEGGFRFYGRTLRKTKVGIEGGIRLPDPPAPLKVGMPGLSDLGAGRTVAFSAEVAPGLYLGIDVGRFTTLPDTALASSRFSFGGFGRGEGTTATNGSFCTELDMGAKAGFELSLLKSALLDSLGLGDGLKIFDAEFRMSLLDKPVQLGACQVASASDRAGVHYVVVGRDFIRYNGAASAGGRDVWDANGQWLRDKVQGGEAFTIDLSDTYAKNPGFANLAIEAVLQDPAPAGASGFLELIPGEAGKPPRALFTLRPGQARPGDTLRVKLLAYEPGRRGQTITARWVWLRFEVPPVVAPTYELQRLPDGSVRYGVKVNYADDPSHARTMLASVVLGDGRVVGFPEAFRVDVGWWAGEATTTDVLYARDGQDPRDLPKELLLETGITSDSADSVYRYPIARDTQPAVDAILFDKPDAHRVLDPVTITVHGRNLPGDLVPAAAWCADMAEIGGNPAMLAEGLRSTVERTYACTAADIGAAHATSALGHQAPPHAVLALEDVVTIQGARSVLEGQPAEYFLSSGYLSEQAKALLTAIWSFTDAVGEQITRFVDAVTHAFVTVGTQAVEVLYKAYGRVIGLGTLEVGVTASTGAPVVASVGPLAALAGVAQTFTVQGINLPADLTINLPGCEGIVPVAGGSATQRAFQCTFPIGTPADVYPGSVARGSSPFGPPALFDFAVVLTAPAVRGVSPMEATRTLATPLTITGSHLPTAGLAVVPSGQDGRSSCQPPTGLSPSGLGVVCELFTVGRQTLEVRAGSQVVGTIAVNVKSNVEQVTWTSSSTASSGTVRFGELVTFNVHGVNLTADAALGFAVERCGVSNAEVGTPSATLRRFQCVFNNDAGAVAGLMPGVVKDAPGGQVLLDGWSVPVEVAAPPAGTGSRLVDTGIGADQCYRAGSDALVSCRSPEAIALSPTQDGMLGRDADAATNSGADGRLGFSFTKVGADGRDLPNDAPVWDCVRDNVTGLMWEVKTSDGGLRDRSRLYTNFDDPDRTQLSDGSRPTQAQIDAATNSAGYRNQVNAQGLCGHSDWRLPTVDELLSIVDLGVPGLGLHLDVAYFPNSVTSSYWSSDTLASADSIAWGLYMNAGDVSLSSRDTSGNLRLVRVAR